ncbi:penicillin-binding protein [Bifidobacterium primatium]|uniref:Penicillin-binding protein n=2 Tax=Bifidobacterium TaxID=1678 RepID=A0A2M9HBR9_9BIFI|nr:MULTISPECIES: penicillin-binding protein 2 [Bifidobacterium]NEG95576.1 penicillin-binding protein 2 [Bifidobacterium sp. SMB2]NEH12490.1 penicillin-binding protein 2 [Bifidobacterium saimiriisciurei]PJM74260.1 penicillin-binding protein [Bifidobacterium primatium]
MNTSLRQLFTAVIVLFAVLGLSTTRLMTIQANSLNADPRNVRALYHEYGAPRGSILASDGTVLAKSEKTDDAFSYQRSYSNGAVYAPVTGYFSVTTRADRGIEASRNTLLTGENSSLWLSKFKSLFTGEENKGANIETSISPKLQKLAYQLLGDQQGAVVAMEPKTGRILAMVSTPSYDPNALASHKTSDVSSAYQKLIADKNNPMLNRTTNELYPPGSTFKIVVAAAALESGDYDTNTSVAAGSSYTLPGTVTQLTNTSSAAAGSNGKISLEDAFAYSSNTAFAQLGVKLGQEKVAAQAKKMGFGSSITVDGTSSSGLVSKATASKFPDNASPDKLALASIGQGDTLETPMLNAMIASAVANGGKMMQPTLVDRVRGSDLSVVSESSPSTFSQAFSEDTANKLNTMMQAVITKEDPQLQLDGVKVAAKTGTAQIGNNSTNDSWITGFAPADDPKIAVAVVVHNVNAFGSEAAGPIMQQIMQEALKQ